MIQSVCLQIFVGKHLNFTLVESLNYIKRSSQDYPRKTANVVIAIGISVPLLVITAFIVIAVIIPIIIKRKKKGTRYVINTERPRYWNLVGVTNISVHDFNLRLCDKIILL